MQGTSGQASATAKMSFHEEACKPSSRIGLVYVGTEARFFHIKLELWFLTKFLTCTTAITKHSRQGLDQIPVTRRLKFLSNFKLTKMKIS